MAKTALFFVYGTLKEGGHFARYFDKVRKNSRIATLEGYALYNLGWFPGIVIEENSYVIGELHEYTKPGRVTNMMDNIEGYHEEQDDGLYLRRTTKVRLDSGDELEASVYVFGSEIPDSAEKIEDGIWKI